MNGLYSVSHWSLRVIRFLNSLSSNGREFSISPKSSDRSLILHIANDIYRENHLIIP